MTSKSIKNLWPLLVVGGIPACQSVGGFPSRMDPHPNPNSIRDIHVADTVTESSEAKANSKDDSKKNVSVSQEELYYGDEAFFRESALEAGDKASAIHGVMGESFSFRDAPLELVLNQILGETFGLSYSLDPQVSANITLRLEGIATRDQAVAGLDAALNIQGLQITEQDGTYVVARAGTQAREATLPVYIAADDDLSSDAPVAVLQIQYADVEDVTNIASSMLPSGMIQYADDDRGVVVLSGEPDEVSSAVKLLRSLDVNWLSSVSTALIPIANAAPKEIAADVQPILERIGGISIIPLDRLQTLMVIARQGETLDQAREWISRLDQDATPKLTSDLLIYEARHVNAEDLIALTTNDTMNGGNRFLGAPSGQMNPQQGNPQNRGDARNDYRRPARPL